jgi:hypothetical protein
MAHDPYKQEESDMLNPFYIAENKAGEDQMTFAFACTLQQIGLPGLLDLLQTLDKRVDGWDTSSWIEESSNLEVRPQVRGPKSVPDAGFKLSNKLHLLFENKSRGVELRQDQIKNHLMVFTDAEFKVMLGITYITQPPVWWKTLQQQYPDIYFVYGSWNKVRNWVKNYLKSEELAPVARYLLEQFMGKYLALPPKSVPAWMRTFYRALYDSGKRGITYSSLDFKMIQAGPDLVHALRVLDSHLIDAGGLYAALLESRHEQGEWVFSLRDDFLRGDLDFDDFISMVM